MEFHKTHRREPTEPQLATMIDVFSLLIIFLIAGTVMGTTSIVVPEGVKPPRSISKEDLLTAPQLTIVKDQVVLSFEPEPFPLSSFTENAAVDSQVQRFKEAIQRQIKAGEGKSDANLVNFVSDESTHYDTIFNVIRLAREAGFASILFVSSAKRSRE